MIELLRTRRSIRKFQAKKIEPAKIDALIEALLRSPSSRGINPWRFYLVENQKLLVDLAAAKNHGGEFLKVAPLGVVICADDTKSDVWVEDCSIAAIICQLTAHSLGLGSCWIQIRNRVFNETQTAEARIRDILNIPTHIKIECIMALGYPAEKPQPIPAEKLDHGKILRLY
jgi:nitroreductase